MDLRAAVRGLLRHRSVTVLAVACLALGVGTSGAMRDPLVLACAAILVLALSLLASYIPGRRLKRIDRAMALRAE